MAAFGLKKDHPQDEDGAEMGRLIKRIFGLKMTAIGVLLKTAPQKARGIPDPSGQVLFTVFVFLTSLLTPSQRGRRDPAAGGNPVLFRYAPLIHPFRSGKEILLGSKPPGVPPPRNGHIGFCQGIA